MRRARRAIEAPVARIEHGRGRRVEDRLVTKMRTRSTCLDILRELASRLMAAGRTGNLSRVMARLRTLSSLLAALLLVAGPASAHDYWLEFQPLAPAVDDEFALSLWVGEDFVAEAQREMLKARTVSFCHVTGAADEDLLPGAREGATPLVQLRLEQSGGHLFGVERDAKRIELRALKFNRYLKHEGLTQAFAERKRAGERFRRARERYSRYLKAFAQVGDTADGVSMRPLGHPIELLPERDLAGLRAGDKLPVRLVFEGKPLAGAKIEAFVKAAENGPS